MDDIRLAVFALLSLMRGSRALNSDPNTVDVGPIRYEVIEPLHRVR